MWRVGVCDRPPYSMKRLDGTWGGLAVDLWQSVAVRSGISYELVPSTLSDIETQLAAGNLDAAATGMVITAGGERLWTYTHPFEVAGFTIVCRDSGERGIGATLKHLVSREMFIWTVGVLAAVVVAGVVIYAIERRRNPGFAPGLRGVADGIWWSITTLSTVGYGDRVPVTHGGRIFGGLWMLLAFGVMTVFSGVLAAHLTVGRLLPDIQSASDLRGLTVGTVRGGGSETLFGDRSVARVLEFETPEQGLDALAAHQVDAFVGDTVSMRYLLRQDRYSSLDMANQPLNIMFMALGISPRTKSETVEILNCNLLDLTDSEAWEKYVRDALGFDP